MPLHFSRECMSCNFAIESTINANTLGLKDLEIVRHIMTFAPEDAEIPEILRSFPQKGLSL